MSTTETIGAGYEVHITGRTPLLMHRDDVEHSDRMDAWRKDPAHKKIGNKGDDRTPGWSWTGYLHHDGEHVVIPREMIFKALTAAGAKLSAGRGSYKATIAGGLWVETDAVLLLDGKPVPVAPIEALRDEVDFDKHLELARKLGIELFTKRVKVGQAKHVRVRPKFNNWSAVLALSVMDTKQITEKILNQAVAHAGFGGIGDWRPSAMSPGWFGQFDAEVRRA